MTSTQALDVPSGGGGSGAARKLIYFAMMSLDGFIARPNGDIEWHTVDEEVHRFVNSRHEALGAYLYGRRMYELMAAAWPPLDGDPAAPDYDPAVPDYVRTFARIWQETPKVVFSKTLARVEGNARLATGDVGAEVTRLKAEPGRPLMVGGAVLAAALMRLGLVDEYQLFVTPIVLGSGIRPFPSLDRSTGLALLETRAFGCGVVFLRYARKGEGQHV